MLPIPPTLRTQFEAYLHAQGVPKMEQAAYAKWLRYYLDFCHKYHFPPQQRGSLAPFLQKLEEKNQTKAQRQQASDGITRYYELLRSTLSPSDGPPPQTVSPPGKIPDGSSHPALLSDREANASPPVSPPEETHEGPSHRPLLSVHEASASLKASSPFSRSQGKAHSEPSPRIDSSSTSVHTSTGVSWTEPYARLAQEIQLRHYSPKTLKSYKQWMQHFQTFTRSKDPLLLSSVDVKEFLTFLAVTKKVSASTQNQAFNALLFFYRYVLNKEFGKIEGVVRAKRKPYIPVVLSREEIDAILAYLPPPYNLVVKLLYGCGLRLSECLCLRVHCFNFDAGILTVHDGKGQKDRTVPLPETILPELRAQIESLKDLHQRDLDQNYAGVFLVHALEKKYKNAVFDNLKGTHLAEF